jgi:hypothetical protein
MAPQGYIVNGNVEWQGEDSNDKGIIKIVNNTISIGRALITWHYDDPLDQVVDISGAPASVRELYDTIVRTDLLEDAD